MLRQLRNIESAFRHVRLFTFILIAGCVAISCYSLYACLSMVSHDHQKIYILANGKLLEAMESDRKDNIAVEMRDHVKMFHYFFFTLDPDGAVIQRNITKALYLADASADRQYENLKESSYYANVISGNITQRIEMDSISLDLKQQPWYFRYYGKLTIVRPTTEVIRNLVTEGYLRNVSRSDNNPHGFLIERWRILQNKDLKIEQRNK